MTPTTRRETSRMTVGPTELERMSDCWEQAVASLSDIVEDERRMGDLVRRVTIRPEHDCWNRCAFDKPDCRPGSGGWHGIGGRQVIWSVAVPGRGAVSFNLHTPIYTENALLRGGSSLAQHIVEWSPLAALDLHYSEPPEYLAEWATPQECYFLEGKCWGDFTMLSADDGFAAYVAGGTPGVWSWLAESRLPDVLNSDRTEADG